MVLAFLSARCCRTLYSSSHASREGRRKPLAHLLALEVNHAEPVDEACIGNASVEMLAACPMHHSRFASRCLCCACPTQLATALHYPPLYCNASL